MKNSIEEDLRKLFSEDLVKEDMKKVKKVTEQNITFIDFVSQKYRRLILKSFRSKRFTTWDDYALWLYYCLCRSRIQKYYELLEDDIKEYSDLQTRGIEEAYDGFFYLKDKVPYKW